MLLIKFPKQVSLLCNNQHFRELLLVLLLDLR
jgi:hypothetical protein